MRQKKVSFLFALLLSGIVSHAQVPARDSLALVAFYNATGGPNWTNHTNWLQPGKNVSTWFGINVLNDRVHYIVLGDNNLTGHIPTEIGELDDLRALHLSSNHLSGTIPSSLDNIDKLMLVFLNNNEYNGQIPAFLLNVHPHPSSSFPREVILDNNDFTSIQNWDSNLIKKLNWLAIENNRLDFQDIEPFLSESIPTFIYDPQKPIYTADKITLREGAVLTLKTTAGGSANHYQWLKDNATITGAIGGNLTMNITQANEGEYSARVTNDLITDLTLERAPIVLHVKEDTVYISCGSPLTLNTAVSDPQATYRWSTGATTPSLVVSASGKYGVQIETTNYISKDTLTVIIYPKLSLGPNVNVCNASLILSSNMTGANSYEWSTPAGTIYDQTSITATANGAYILEVTQNDCIQKDTINVFFYPKLSLGPDVSDVCTASLRLSSNITDADSYEWSTPAGTITGHSSITATASGAYILKVTMEECIRKDTINVFFLPELSLGPDADVCKASLTLSSNITGAGNYEWSTPSGTINDQGSITATASGRYILTVTMAACIRKDTINVILDHFTIGDFTVTAGNTLVDETVRVLIRTPLNFTNITTAGAHFTWSFGDGNTSSDGNPVHNYDQAGEYHVTLSGIDSRDCPIIVEKTIEAQDIFITNAISPNGDGLNDKLYIEPFLYSAELTIINRWGQEVYKTFSYNDDFTGQNLESGVYYYDLYFKEIDKRYKGFFHIMK
jgi:gliding motility-associated-like protein